MPKLHQYDFLGVCNHIGNLDGGHYTAFINYNTRNLKWIKFDDHIALKQEEKDIVTPDAYVLFYKHHSV